MKILNPVIRGFYPDPSVCYANGKFYLVCSSMQYFPGVPLFESGDLVHWKQIGYCLTRSSQIELHGIRSSGGVFAPTIRFHEGRFYMVTTNDSLGKNFFVYTDDIYGEWSEPVFIEQGGIDPSLYFENGKTFFISNGRDEENRPCIFQSEINIETGERLTEPIPIWSGSGGRYLEGPHIYKVGDYYYLMAAEGGTEYGHMVTYARSEHIYGPFYDYPKNPVLTNRDVGGDTNRIQGIGHADLVWNDAGECFMVCLGFRQSGSWTPYHHLGREVFLVPVHWENGWFTAGVNGNVLEEMDVLVDKMVSGDSPSMSYDLAMPFDKADLLKLSYLRDYHSENYEVQKDFIRLTPTEITLDDADAPTFVGIRQSEFCTETSVEVHCSNGEAGVTFYMDEKHHYDLAVVSTSEKKEIILRMRTGSAVGIAKSLEISRDDKIALNIVSNEEKYEFYCILNGKKEIFMGEADTIHLSSEVAGGFTGTFMSLYAASKIITGAYSYLKVEEKEPAVFTKLKFFQKK